MDSMRWYRKELNAAKQHATRVKMALREEYSVRVQLQDVLEKLTQGDDVNEVRFLLFCRRKNKVTPHLLVFFFFFPYI